MRRKLSFGFLDSAILALIASLTDRYLYLL